MNRYLQSALQHTRLTTVTALETGGERTRTAAVALLHALFLKHPQNTCQPSHIGPLIGIYRGTASSADRMVLSIFQLYESTRKTSVASLLGSWNPSAHQAPNTRALDALRSLDAGLVFRSATVGVRFASSDSNLPLNKLEDAALYDPLFVLLLLAQAIVDAAPYSQMEWVELFRTNAPCVAMINLASRDTDLRKLAHTVMSSLWTAVQVRALMLCLSCAKRYL